MTLANIVRMIAFVVSLEEYYEAQKTLLPRLKAAGCRKASTRHPGARARARPAPRSSSRSSPWPEPLTRAAITANSAPRRGRSAGETPSVDQSVSRGGLIRTGDLRVRNAALCQTCPAAAHGGVVGRASLLAGVVAGSALGLVAGSVVGLSRRAAHDGAEEREAPTTCPARPSLTGCCTASSRALKRRLPEARVPTLCSSHVPAGARPALHHRPDRGAVRDHPGRQAIGVWPTIALLFADAILGSMLLRSQGRVAWRRFTPRSRRGASPTREVLDGVLVIFGGALPADAGLHHRHLRHPLPAAADACALRAHADAAQLRRPDGDVGDELGRRSRRRPAVSTAVRRRRARSTRPRPAERLP